MLYSIRVYKFCLSTHIDKLNNISIYLSIYLPTYLYGQYIHTLFVKIHILLLDKKSINKKQSSNSKIAWPKQELPFIKWCNLSDIIFVCGKIIGED